MNGTVEVMAGGWGTVVEAGLCGDALARVTMCAALPVFWQVVRTYPVNEVIWTYMTNGEPSVVWEPTEPYLHGGHVVIQVQATNLSHLHSCDVHATIERRHPTEDEMGRFGPR